MVLKKTNTALNSGSTQRVKEGKAYSGSHGDVQNLDKFSYEANQISICLSPDFLWPACPIRGDSCDVAKKKRKCVDFLVEHLHLEALRDLEFPARDLDPFVLSRRPWEIIVTLSMNKKKGWLLADLLINAVAAHNYMTHWALDPWDERKTLSTEIWDDVAGICCAKKFKGRVPIDSVLRRPANARENGQLNVIYTPQFYHNLVTFGLMDVFNDIPLSVSDEKDSILGFTLRGRARNKSYKTTPPAALMQDEQRIKSSDTTKKRKSAPHARGTQRPSCWNKSSPSKKRRKRREQSESLSDDSTEHSKNTDGINVVITRQPHADARLLGLESVLKKYGHLPYNAPRVAICKYKHRPRGRLGVHMAFTYARLQEEIAIADLEMAGENIYNDSCTITLGGHNGCQKPDERVLIHPVAEDDTCITINGCRQTVTLNDFLVKPAKRRPRKKPKHEQTILMESDPTDIISDGDLDDFVIVTREELPVNSD